MKKYFIYFLITLSHLLFIPLANAQEQLIDEVVAVVGDRIILASDIEIQHNELVMQGNYSDTLRCLVLDQLLLEKLFQNQAEVDSIEVLPEEVDGEIDRRIDYFVQMFGGDTEKLEEYYDKTLLEIRTEFKTEVKDLLLAQKMQAQVIGNVTVSPAEVKAYFNSIPSSELPYYNSEVEMAQLVLKPKVSEDAREKTTDLLLDIKRQVEEGGDFAKFAQEYSQDPGSGANGGDLGWADRGTFVSEFEGAAYRLRKNEISDVVETQFGFHIIQMLERRGDRVHLRHILIKPEISYTDLENTEQRLDSLRNVILNDTITFKEAVEKYSEDENSKSSGGLIYNQQTGSSFFEMNEVEASVYFVIDTLQEGELSKPARFEMSDGSEAYRIIYLYSRTKPHVANLADDYSRMQQIVEADKREEIMNNWLNRNIPKTYINIDEKYISCRLLDRWVRQE